MPTIHAPEIDLPGLQWFNTDTPLGLAELRGRLVILDFWTFCCINCIQIIPTLKRIEHAFPDEVVVIGVHSPKFAAEQDVKNVAEAVARYEIEHPVVHDPDFTIWQSYAVRAWPTLMFVGPEGDLLGQASGEPDPDRLFDAISGMLGEFRARGVMSPLPPQFTQPPAPAGRLSWPGKIKALPDHDEAVWAIADGGHHQIVLIDDHGNEHLRIGSGESGFEDGSFDEACFAQPQGLSCRKGMIYVADTANHAIREINLEAGTVTTLSGTGRRGQALPVAAPALGTALASPWDLALDEDGRMLYFANAGTHQLGSLNLEDKTVHRLAGNSGESIVDGPADQAQLAQPSGLVLNKAQTHLYFADSETSSIRSVDLEKQRVHTLVGTGLFDFGHANGSFASATLQHALGLDLLADDQIIVADSYNATLRTLDMTSKQVTDFDDNLYECLDQVCLPLAEPAGIASDPANNRVLVSDTNNHRILAYDLSNRTYRTLLQ